MDNKTKILIFFPLILIIILLLIPSFIHFKKEFPDSEKQILKIKPLRIKIKQRQEIYAPNESLIAEELKGPLDFRSTISQQDTFPPEALDNLLLNQDFTGKGGLSLTVISGESRMAVINGVVVKEGDSISEAKIAKIEHDRVLLKNKTTQWLYMEKIK